jgi:hypothetical protein
MKLVGKWAKGVFICPCRLISLYRRWPVVEKPSAIVPKVGRNIPHLQLVIVIHY